MEFDKKQVVYAVAVALSIIAWAFFLNASNITIESVLSFSAIDATIAGLMSTNFILFLLLFPLTHALVIVLCRKEEKTTVQLIALAGLLAGSVISFLAFANIASYLIIGVFYIIYFFPIIETACLRFAELKKFVVLRSVGEITSMGILAVAIGLFALSSLTIMENQDKYFTEFEDMMLSSISGGGQMDYAGMGADLMIKIQKQPMDLIMNSPQYIALTSKDDPDVTVFVLMVGRLRLQLDSEEYREAIVKEAEKTGFGGTGGGVNIMDMVKEKIPLFRSIEKWFWLVESFFLASIFLTVGKLILGMLAVIYGLVLDKVIPGEME